MLKIRTSAGGAGHRAPAARPSASRSFRLAQYRIVCIWNVMLLVPPWPGASSLLIRSYWRGPGPQVVGAQVYVDARAGREPGRESSRREGVMDFVALTGRCVPDRTEPC